MNAPNRELLPRNRQDGAEDLARGLDATEDRLSEPKPRRDGLAAASLVDSLIAEAKPERLPLDSGGEVRLATGPCGQVVRVEGAGGTLLLEYDPAAELTRVHVPRGNLEFVADDGDIAFTAAGRVRLRGRRADVEAPDGVCLAAGEAARGEGSRIEVQPGRLRLASRRIGLLGKRAELQLEQLLYSGERLRAKLGRAKIVAGRLETEAQTVVSRAKNVFQKTEDLLQLQAGRVRSLVRSTFSLKSHRLTMKAKLDANIDGERINLG